MPAGPDLTAFAIVLGAAAVALWCHVRFPRLAPDDFRRSLVHMGVSTLLACILVRPGLALAGLAGPTAGPVVGVFTIVFPILVYCLLASLWVLRVAKALLPSR